LAGVEEADVVGENFGVIESERCGRIARIDQCDGLGVVGGDGRSSCARDIDGGDGLAARIAIGARVDSEQRAQFDLE
jgi:hypothetical protein